MATQRRHHATISGEDLYRRVIETARSGKRLPAGALLDADNYSDVIRAMTNANNMDDNTAAVVRRYLGLAHGSATTISTNTASASRTASGMKASSAHGMCTTPSCTPYAAMSSHLASTSASSMTTQ